MNLVSRITSMFRREPQNAVEFSPELWAAIQANGINYVSWRKAVEVAAIMACARKYGNDLAVDPWKIMQTLPNGDKVEAEDHKYYNLITYEPNSYQTNFEFRQTLGFHLALTGNAFVWLDRVGPRQEKIQNLLPLDPSWVSVCRRDDDWGALKYRVTFPDGTVTETDNRFIWHIRNMSWDNYSGLSALSYAREAINLSKDIASSQSNQHKSFARPSGVLSVKQTMTAAQYKAMREMIDFQVQTRLSRGLPMVVDNTAEWENLASKATDMQSMETREQISEEIAIHMGLLPAILGFNSQGSQTYASVEQLEIRHSNHFKRPLLTNFEQTADRWMLSKEDRKAKIYNHIVDQAILRADIKGRAEYYRTMWSIGAYRRNEIRGKEDMNAIKGGDYTWAPLANAPVGDDGMHMISDAAPVDNNFKQGDIQNIADLFRNATPQQKVQFAAMMQAFMKPEEHGD